MPRSVQEILDHADELAKRFEDREPDEDNIQDAAALRELRHAVLRRADVEKEIGERVEAARAAGHAWAQIGMMLGTSGEAARQKYGAASGEPPPVLKAPAARKAPAKKAATKNAATKKAVSASKRVSAKSGAPRAARTGRDVPAAKKAGKHAPAKASA